MPRGGFYAIHNSHLRFGRDGRWYADGEPITNARIADLFSRHVQRAADGSYVLRIADEQATVEVDDTPYVVTGAIIDGSGEVWIELNDHTRERLDPYTLRVGRDEVLYCRVKNGAEPARFLRPAYYQLAEHIAPAGPDRFVFRSPGGTFAIEPR
jgi:hypothetical protein